MKLKKFLSVFMVCVMGACAAAACAPGSSGAQTENDDHVNESGELQILKSDYSIPAEETMSRIKAEYLIENKGYRDSDEVVAILSLRGDALIDDYLADEELSAKYSLAEYAASPAGAEKQAGILFEQTDLIRRLQSEGLIGGVEYRYNTIANAVAVTMSYGNFLMLEKAGYCENVALSETYSHPQEAKGTDASAIVNDVDVYETGIFNSESAKDPSGNPYTGKGTSVAVLDSGFDLSHPAYNTHQIEGTPMFSRDRIESFVESAVIDGSPIHAVQMSPGLAVSDVYYKDKIPFKYDYADKDSDVFPYDSEHGTHVAGIIGGYANEYQDKDGNTVYNEDGSPKAFKGIAIDTQLVLMKVFPDLQTGARTPDILAALEDAVLLGVDAINMSLGSACGFTREADGNVVNAIYDKINESGTSLIIAAGNEYSSGYGGAQGNTNRVTNPDSGTIGSPASYPASLSVASISGVKSKYLVSGNDQVVFFNESSSISGEENDFYGELYDALGWAKDDTKHTIEYVTVPGYGYRANYTTINVQGKIALVSRGDNTFEDKALQAKLAGAAACIIYNNIEGDIRMSMGKSDHIPTVSISKEDGVRLAQSRTGTLTFSYGQQAGPFMSDFSCWGPLPDLTLKPEITAHGGNITSSFPGGGYGTISGTSMACPNLCGIVLLIRQYVRDNYNDLTGKNKPSDDGVDVETENATYMKDVKNLTNKLLMSTAGIVLNEQGNPYSPRKQGAGLASLKNAVTTKAYIETEKGGEVQDRTKLELGDDKERTGVYEMYINVVNTSVSPIRYKLGVIGMTESVSTADDDFVAERAQLLNGSMQAAVLSGNGQVEGDAVTVNGKSGEGAEPNVLKLKVTYTLSQEDKDLIDNSFPYGMFVEGYVTLEATAEQDVDLNVPFLAFYGDWTKAPVFDKTYYEVETEAHNAGIDDEDKIKADYYATTPYGSYRYNYIIPLGTYLYTVDESSYDPIPATAEHAAISDSLNTLDGISAVYEGLLRGCKTMHYTITDKVTGEVIYDHIDDNARKAYSQGGSPIPGYDETFDFKSVNYNMINNRRYEFRMVGLLDYGDGGQYTNARNTFTFDFTYDTEAPVIKSATYEKKYDKTLKKDRYYVNLTIYDNAYAMALIPGIFTPNPEYKGQANQAQIQFTSVSANPIPLYSEKGQDYTLRYEITDLLPNIKYDSTVPSSLVFAVEDYALNENLFICQLPGTRGAFRFTEDGSGDGKTLSTLTVGINEVKDLTQYLYTSDATAGGVEDVTDYLRNLSWSSSNKTIADVQYGQVRGLRAGKALITVSDPLKYNNTATIYVQVTDKGTAEAETAWTLSSGNPDNNVSFISANDVDNYKDAKIRDLRFAYFETIKAYSQVAGEASDIGDAGDRIFLTAHRGGIEMFPGESIQLFYDVEPWYVKDNYQFTFGSDRPDVLTVDQNGVIKALKKGNATVTLTVNGSNLMASLRITVNSEFVIDEARTLVAYKGPGGDVVIPDDEGILYIGPFCFSLFLDNDDYLQKLPSDDMYANRIPLGNNTVTSVKIPNGVTEIQQTAFYRCTALREVQLPDTIKFIRQYAFQGDTALEKIDLSSNVEVIGASAFEGCTRLNDFGDGVGTAENPLRLNSCYAIGERAFYGCTALTAIDLTHLRNTGESAFMNCSNLSEVVFDEDGLTKLSGHIFDGCGLTEVTCYEKNIIPAYAFANNKSLTSFTFAGENGLESIGGFAFSGDTALAEITLPNSGFALGEKVFNNCTNLAKVILQAKTQITSAQGSIFNGCGLQHFELADGADTAYKLSDDKTQLLSQDGSEIILAAVNATSGEVTVPTTVTSVRAGAFSGANLTSVTFEGAVKLGEYAFADCKQLTTVKFADAEGSTIGNGAFAGCTNLNSVEKLDKVSAIGNDAFNGDTALTSVSLADGVTVGEGSFRSSGLTSATFNGEATIGASAFRDCANLATVTLSGDTVVGAYAFSGDGKLADVDLSKVTDEIAERAFYGCGSLTTVNLTKATKIGAYAFADCAKLATVTLGNELTEIGTGAFMDFTLFRSGKTPKGPVFTEIVLTNVKTIGEAAFFGCAKLTSVTVPGGISELPDNIFAYCTALTTVTLADVTKIGNFAFAGCTSLSSVDLAKVTEIGAAAFYMAKGLESATLSQVTKIGSLAFADTGLSGTVEAPELTELENTVLDRNIVNLGAAEISIPEIAAIIPDVIDESNIDLGDYVFSGSYAFRNAKFTAFTAPKLAVIGIGAFYGNTALTGFEFGSALESIGEQAFGGCTAITEFTIGDDAGGRAHIKDGVLYLTLENGKQKLAAVPAGMAGKTLDVEEGTVHIAAYAGNENQNITSIILPDSLDSIGEYAFYGYNALESVEFRSVTAPALESSYNSLDGLTEGDPGYDILCSQFSLYQSEKLCYYNFIDLVGKKQPIRMILPKNADISGYDNIVYLVYFGEVAKADRSEYTAMEQSMKNFLEYGRKVAAIKIEELTLDDEKLVSDAVVALNGVKQDPADFGIDGAEWENLKKAVNEAWTRIVRLKIEYAKKIVRDIQARIDALSDTYENTEAQDAEILSLQAAIANLETDDRNLLVQDKYTKLLAAYNAAHPSTDPGTDPGEDPGTEPGEEPGEADKGCGYVIGIVGGAVALAVLIGAAVLIIVKKKKKNKKE